MPRTGAEQRVAVEQLEVAGELLDAVDLAAALDLDRDDRAGGVAAQQVDRADRGRVLAADQRQPVAERLEVLGEQLLQVRLDAVLLQAGVDAELVAWCRAATSSIVMTQLLAGLVGRPSRRRRRRSVVLAQRAGRAHPVQRLVGAGRRRGPSTEPSALTSSSRVAIGRWAVSRPT